MQCLRSAIRDSQQPTSPIGFLFLKLAKPPCAVLLVYNHRKMDFTAMDFTAMAVSAMDATAMQCRPLLNGYHGNGCHSMDATWSQHKRISQERDLHSRCGLIEAHFQVKIPTIWTDGKAQVG